MSTSSNIKYINNVLKATKNNLNKKSGLSIGQKIYDIVNNEYNMLISIILIGILIIAIIILYRKSFKFQKDLTLSNINIPKRKLTVLPICNEISPDDQYRLCDYYICASYNTQCVGAQHFDYVSEEMYKSALLNGARYIELPIFSYGVEEDSYPVVATGYDNKFTITSLNTITFDKVLSTIKNYAFKYYNETNPETFKNINYPLIINLKIHTDNTTVLNKAKDYIIRYFNKLLLKPEKYKRFPIQFEKLCMLTNKIILISNNNLVNNLFSDIVIPTSNFLNVFNINKIKQYILSTNSKNYYKTLSLTYQKNNVKILNNVNLILEEFLEKGKNSNIFKLINDSNLNSEELLNNLIIFNMIGMTIINYNNEVKLDSSNIDFSKLVLLGCQIIPMNFQTNDKIILNYIDMFKNNSFILKPSSIRLPIIEEDIKNSMDNYDSKLLNVKNIPIIPNFIVNNNNSIISIQEVSSDFNRHLTSNTNSFKFNQIKLNDDKKYNINNNNLFYIRKSPLSKLNDLILIIIKPENSDREQALTIINDEISLAPIDEKSLKYQSFYPLTGYYNDNNILIELIKNYYNPKIVNSNKFNKDYGFLTLATYISVIENPNGNYNFLGIDKNKLVIRTLSDIDSNNSNNNENKMITFFYTNINIKETTKIFNSQYGFLKINTQKNIIGLFRTISQSNASNIIIETFDINKFKVLTEDSNNNVEFRELKINKLNNDGLITRVIIFKTLDNKYLYCSDNNYLLTKSSFNNDCIFLLSKNLDNEYNIKNEIGGTMFVENNGLLKFNSQINDNDNTTKFKLILDTKIDI